MSLIAEFAMNVMFVTVAIGLSVGVIVAIVGMLMVLKDIRDETR